MNKKILLTSAVLALLATSCTPTVAQRGNLLEDHQLEEVVLGVHSRTDVLRILGSPTTTAPFDDRTWYYMGQETEKRGILDPEVMKERVVVVNFDQEGIVTRIDDKGSQRENIPVSRDKTPTHGNDITIMQEFLGNLGRFNPNSGGAVGGGRGAPRN